MLDAEKTTRINTVIEPAINNYPVFGDLLQCVKNITV
jgi:hypothetical protein